MADGFFRSSITASQFTGNTKSKKKSTYFSSTPTSFDFIKSQNEVNNADFLKKKSA